jgi:hypothetical protein
MIPDVKGLRNLLIRPIEVVVGQNARIDLLGGVGRPHGREMKRAALK